MELMESKNFAKDWLQKGIYGVLAFMTTMLCIMGYYPLVPSFYAAYCLKKQRNLFLYLPLAVGMMMYMPLAATVKYSFILAMIFLAVQFYIWANRSCSGAAAGVIAALLTIVMNFSEDIISLSILELEKNELILGIGEGCVVFSATMIFHYLDSCSEQFSLWIPEFAGMGGLIPSSAAVSILTEEEQENRMMAFVTAVDGLSEAFYGMSRPKEKNEYEQITTIEQEVTGRLCAGCDGCTICWNENRATLTESIRKLIRAVLEHHSREELLEEQYLNDCIEYPQMVEAALGAFGRMELNYAWYLRLMENRQVIAQQLNAMSSLMQDWNRVGENIDEEKKLWIARISYEVAECGLAAEQIHIYKGENGKIRIRADVYGKWSSGIPVRHYLKAVEKATGLSLRTQKDAKSILTKEPNTIVLFEDTIYFALQGIALQKKDGATISGDNFSVFQQDDGKYHVCLSDGMGSGTSASQESEMVVDLLEKFMEAGFQKDTAIKMMNSAMVLKGEDNKFSTLDYATIDLYTGDLEMIKIGAAAAYIKHGRAAECIQADSLPAGVDIEQPIPAIHKKLQKGDFLVMVSDGVLEYLHAENPEEKLSEIISDIRTDNAGVLARNLLNQVLLFTGGHALDDMTVLVTGIWEK